MSRMKDWVAEHPDLSNMDAHDAYWMGVADATRIPELSPFEQIERDLSETEADATRSSELSPFEQIERDLSETEADATRSSELSPFEQIERDLWEAETAVKRAMEAFAALMESVR